jgi:hemerythrin-like domain-containing protein
MSTVPNLLNDDQTASIATALMMSHHGFRRDLARFETALEKVAQGDGSRIEALREEWKTFNATLHGHHHSEDTGVFPNIAAEHASLCAVIEQLSADHRRIDPLLERGQAAFAALPNATDARAVVRELSALLAPHLATEEREIIPFLRGMKVFPPPPDDNAAAMYAEGFAWAMQGIAPDVLEKVYAMLPEVLLVRLPAARAAFDARCERVWGSVQAGAARTPIPDSVDTSSAPVY